jgi:hypothetical protein
VCRRVQGCCVCVARAAASMSYGDGSARPFVVPLFAAAGFAASLAANHVAFKPMFFSAAAWWPSRSPHPVLTSIRAAPVRSILYTVVGGFVGTLALRFVWLHYHGPNRRHAHHYTHTHTHMHARSSFRLAASRMSASLSVSSTSKWSSRKWTICPFTNMVCCRTLPSLDELTGAALV